VLAPDVFVEDDHLENYAFRIQAVSGGVPLPPPIGLVGSPAGYPCRTLQGSIKRSVSMRGSIGVRVNGQIGKTRRRQR
jgi:hypothetical protein